ncbi:hypothetical protein PUN4_270042 [Paraburkholderia unamae]|nr:hypothetical protein PUN4_270042 [Paraburkholderia unamae]
MRCPPLQRELRRTAPAFHRRNVFGSISVTRATHELSSPPRAPLPDRWHKTGYNGTRHPAAAIRRDSAGRHDGRTDGRLLDALVICRPTPVAPTIHK